MSEDLKRARPRYREGLLGAVSVGFFFLLVGGIFAATPNLYEATRTFFNDFQTVSVPHMTNVTLPAPKFSGIYLTEYTTVFTAVWEFCLIWGVFQISILALRFVVRSSTRKEAQAAGNVAFWLGASYLVTVLLNEQATTNKWFEFWALIIVLLGISLIVRSIVRAVGK